MGFWREKVVQPALDRDLNEAIAEQQALLDRDPRNPHAYFNLATLYHLQGRTEEAMALFRRAIDLDPTSAAPHASLGRIEAVRGNNAAAWKHAREAERLGDCSLVELLERYPIRDAGR